MPSNPPDPGPGGRAAVQRAVDFFEALQPADLARLGEVYAPHAYFKDPFNELRGLAGIEGVYRHMFEALDKPRFVVTEQVVDGQQCFLVWDFEFRFRRFDQAALQTVRGTSHLKFNAAGLIEFHRDYWDAAEELYEKLPGVGSLMRWFKKRAAG